MNYTDLTDAQKAEYDYWIQSQKPRNEYDEFISTWLPTMSKNVQDAYAKIECYHPVFLRDPGQVGIVYAYNDNGTVTFVRRKMQHEDQFSANDQIGVFGIHPNELEPIYKLLA